MNFYELSSETKIDVEILFKKYNELYPYIKLYDYSVGLTKNEIELLKTSILKN